ncbi:MAG: type II secretion system protein [Candidatus Aminicenantes bacterium]|nr:type II secretion system protein [Candidatus Aminicenantes bacterium]
MSRRRRPGFTLIELLVVVAILGILMALLLPVIQTAMQKARQKATMSDISILSKAILSYTTDHGKAPTSPDGAIESDAEIIGELLSLHIRPFVIDDRWGFPFRAWTGVSVAGCFGIDAGEVGVEDFVVQSVGRDGQDEGFVYNPADSEGNLFSILDIEDFNNDLIIWNGSWIHAPRPGG